MNECVYREESNVEVKTCYKFGKCKLTDGDKHTPACDTCNQRLELKDPQFLKKWEDPLDVLDRQKFRTTAVRNLLAGTPAFLIGGGPSLNDNPVEKLSERGIWSMGINNVAGHPKVRPQAFLCSDPPLKFSHSIWLDPGIMKFIPTPKLSGGRAKLRYKEGKHFKPLEKRTFECPNVWGFNRNSWLTPDDWFFLSNGACWGNHKAGVERTGEEKTVCTLLLGMRLMRYLGCSKLYLLGVDFHMKEGYGYSFNQARDGGACKTNNNQFRIVSGWLQKMQDKGVFEKFGMPVFNCFEKSGLRAFPYVPFEEAIEDARGIVEKVPSLSGWYSKKDKEKK